MHLFPFANPHGGGSVRVINEKEVKRRLPEIFSSKEKSLTNEKFLYVGLGLLRRAFETKDEMNIKSALGKVHPWVPRIGVRSVSADANIWHLARWDYAGVMSNALQNARLVVWFPFESTRLLSPGVYCPDLKTAAYITMVIGSIRICPKCENTFIPKTDNQDYCEPKHGIAHRTALSQ